MKKQIQRIAVFAAACAMGISVQAQDRYLDEVFDNSEITIQKDITYAINVDFIKNTQLLDPAYVMNNQAQISAERDSLMNLIDAGSQIPVDFFQPFSANSNTILKVSELKMDVYMPDKNADTAAERPVIVYLHTGNFLPPVINGGTGGSKEDSVAVELCKQWAKRGYVAVAPNYRHGWNPAATGITGGVVRRATLLNAVYRAIHDAKQSVRVMREDFAEDNNYGIDVDRVVLYGQGSGGYVALAYNAIDRQEDTETPKFLNPQSGQSYVQPSLVGSWEGFGGLLNLYSSNGQSADVQAVVHAGGTLGDISWLKTSASPIISLHCVRDPFAPFDTGNVIVPTTEENVVPVPGPNQFMPRANNLGINDVYINETFNDVYTQRAQSTYGQTYTHYLNNVTVSTDAEGMFPFVLPFAQDRFENQGTPWEWWSKDDLDNLVAAVNAQTGGTYDANDIHNNALNTNPGQGRSKALPYIDTIQNYIQPRLIKILEDVDPVSVRDKSADQPDVSVFPNPAVNDVTIMAKGSGNINRVEIFNVSGKLIYSRDRVESPVLNITTNTFTKGMYLVKITAENTSVVKRLMVQ